MTAPTPPVVEPPPSSRSRWDWRPRLRWFAAEFLVVVTGILVAFAINAWWQGRQDAASEANYLALVARDLDQMAENLNELVAYEDRQVQSGLAAYRALSALALSETEQATVSESVTQLMSRRTMSPTDATYEDLLSTGNIRLIQNEALRNRLVSFYEEAERAFDIHNKNNTLFVDELFARELLRRGLFYNRAGSGVAFRSRVDSLLYIELTPGYVEDADPIWRLPPSAGAWDVLRALVLHRARIAAYARQFARTQLEETRALQQAVAAEANR